MLTCWSIGTLTKIKAGRLSESILCTTICMSQNLLFMWQCFNFTPRLSLVIKVIVDRNKYLRIFTLAFNGTELFHSCSYDLSNVWTFFYWKTTSYCKKHVNCRLVSGVLNKPLPQFVWRDREEKSTTSADIGKSGVNLRIGGFPSRSIDNYTWPDGTCYVIFLFICVRNLSRFLLFWRYRCKKARSTTSHNAPHFSGVFFFFF